MAHLKRSPISDDLDAAPRILRLIAAATMHAGDESSAEVKLFATTLARRFVRTAQILEADDVRRRWKGKRKFWEDLAFAERRQKVKSFREAVDEVRAISASRVKRPLTAFEKAQLAEFDARAATAAGGA